MNRHIDNLGRIVIPKEIRKKLHIEEDDCLNIQVENEKIIICKDNDSLQAKITELIEIAYNSEMTVGEFKEFYKLATGNDYYVKKSLEENLKKGVED